VFPDIFTFTHRDLIVSLANRGNLPAVYPFTVFASAGGLVSYGVDLLDLQRRAAGYVDRILKGTKPEDLPVQLPRNSNWPSISRRLRRLGSLCHHLCWLGLMR
jgi:putative ABC transport system substrate-binding protein